MRKLMSRLSLIVVLTVTAFIGLTARNAHAAAKATYTVIVGTDTPYGLESLIFSPQTLKVHRGDTVTWQFRGFHNVRFDQKNLDILADNDIDGKKLPELNPQILFPNAKGGDVFKAGINTGIPLAGPNVEPFSLVMDVEPGTYSYVCDVHPGMVGSIVVVEDSVQIPSPDEVDKASQAEIASALADGERGYLDALKKFSAPPTNGTLQVADGIQENLTSVNLFFPSTATIQTGTTVNWTVPKGFNIHTVNLPLAKEGRVDAFTFMLDSKKTPHAVFSDAGVANVKSGDELPADGVAKSGILAPGQSFALKFTKPGVYAYYCAIHPDQFGILEVVPPQPQP